MGELLTGNVVLELCLVYFGSIAQTSRGRRLYDGVKGNFFPIFIIAAMAIAGWVLQKRVVEAAQDAQADMGLQQTLLVESLAGMETLKSLGGEGGMIGRWRRLAEIGTHSQQKLRHVTQLLQERHADQYTIVVASPASQQASEQYLAPYAACAMGEHFMQQHAQGIDVGTVIDHRTGDEALRCRVVRRAVFRLVRIAAGGQIARQAGQQAIHVHALALDHLGGLAVVKDEGAGDLIAAIIALTGAQDLGDGAHGLSCVGDQFAYKNNAEQQFNTLCDR